MSKPLVSCAYCHQKVDTRKLGYLQAHDDAQRRMKAGQKQRQCPHCRLWCWADELPKRKGRHE